MKRALTAFLLLTTLLTTLLTAACSWHLRGSVDVGKVQSVHVSAENQQSDFVKTLKRTLSNQGVAVEANAPAAQFSLVILAQNSNRRTASVGSSARAAEFRLIEEVRYLVLDKAGQLLLRETTTRAERTFDFDENQVIGKGDEAELIREELQRNIIRQIINRLKRLSPAAKTTPADSHSQYRRQ